MFYAIDTTVHAIERSELDPNVLTVGYISAADLVELGPRYGFSRATVQACQRANQNFRSGVEVYDDYTFTELRVIDSANIDGKPDCVALYIMKNLLLVVDVDDRDGSISPRCAAMRRTFAAWKS